MQSKIEGLDKLLELYNSNTINREEFEILKKELFLDKAILSSSIPKHYKKNQYVGIGKIEKKQYVGTSNYEKKQSNIESDKTNNNNIVHSQKNDSIKVAKVTFSVIGFFLVFFWALIMSNSNNTTNNNSTPINTPPTNTSTNLNSETNNGVICSICGRKFFGLGYEEVANGVWRESTSNQYFICSVECGLKHTNNMNNVTEKAVRENGVSNGTVCTSCGLGHYVNGICDMCGAASKEVVQEHNSRMPICPLCKGTGIEMPMGANSGGETGRICPECNGSGHISY